MAFKKQLRCLKDTMNVKRTVRLGAIFIKFASHFIVFLAKKHSNVRQTLFFLCHSLNPTL